MSLLFIELTNSVLFPSMYRNQCHNSVLNKPKIPPYPLSQTLFFCLMIRINTVKIFRFFTFQQDHPACCCIEFCFSFENVILALTSIFTFVSFCLFITLILCFNYFNLVLFTFINFFTLIHLHLLNFFPNH